MTAKIQKLMPLIINVIEQPGWTGSCYDMASLLNCTPAAAAKNLHSLRMELVTYVCGWIPKNGGPLPIFARRRKDEQDAPKPTPITAREKYVRRMEKQGKPEPRFMPRRGPPLPEVWLAPPKQSLGIWGL